MRIINQELKIPKTQCQEFRIHILCINCVFLNADPELHIEYKGIVAEGAK